MRDTEDEFGQPGPGLVKQILAACWTEIDEADLPGPMSGDGSYDDVSQLIGEYDYRGWVASANSMGLVGDWGGEDDVEAAVVDAMHEYRDLRARLAAVRALADGWDHEVPPDGAAEWAAAVLRSCARDVRAVLDGPAEAPAEVVRQDDTETTRTTSGDQRHDVYVRISDNPVSRTREVFDGLNVDFDSSGAAVGVEVLGSPYRGVTVDGLWAAPVEGVEYVNPSCIECGGEGGPCCEHPDLIGTASPEAQAAWLAGPAEAAEPAPNGHMIAPGVPCHGCQICLVSDCVRCAVGRTCSEHDPTEEDLAGQPDLQVCRCGRWVPCRHCGPTAAEAVFPAPGPSLLARLRAASQAANDMGYHGTAHTLWDLGSQLQPGDTPRIVLDAIEGALLAPAGSVTTTPADDTHVPHLVDAAAPAMRRLLARVADGEWTADEALDVLLDWPSRTASAVPAAPTGKRAELHRLREKHREFIDEQLAVNTESDDIDDLLPGATTTPDPAAELVAAAAELRKYWRDWSAERRERVRSASRFVHAACERVVAASAVLAGSGREDREDPS